jgi:hypothetical protein
MERMKGTRPGNAATNIYLESDVGVVVHAKDLRIINKRQSLNVRLILL